MGEGSVEPPPCHPAPEPESCHDATPPEAPAQRPGATGFLARHQRVLFVALWLALSGVLVVASVAAYATVPPPLRVSVPAGATVYYNEACSDCGPYLNVELLPALRAANVTPVVVKDYINDQRFRAEMTALSDGLGIPATLRSHLVAFVNASLPGGNGSRLVVLEGHVPVPLVAESLDASIPGAPPRLLVYQDAMEGVTEYRAWGFSAAPRPYPISEPLATFYAWFATQTGEQFGDQPVLQVVLITGFLDGLNPCAFAVLLFFVAFLYAVRAPRSEVLRTGSIYVYAVFLVYFLIGLGLLRAIILSNDPHLMAKIGAVLVIVLGGLTLTSFAFPKVPLIAKMPTGAWVRVRGMLTKGSLPAATVAGVAVGLCTFPCSGGIYVAILGYLASRTSFLEGLGYLYLYNLMFIVPLVAVLVVVSNRQLALRAAAWERLNARVFKIAMSAMMIAMGVVLLVLVM